jgi:hypothetical protein
LKIAHRLDDIGLEIGPTDDAFIGCEVDQYERPVRDGGNAGDDGALQFEDDRARGDAPEGQRRDWHGGPCYMRVLSFHGEAGRMLAAEQRFAKRDAAPQRKKPHN